MTRLSIQSRDASQQQQIDQRSQLFLSPGLAQSASKLWKSKHARGTVYPCEMRSIYTRSIYLGCSVSLRRIAGLMYATLVGPGSLQITHRFSSPAAKISLGVCQTHSGLPLHLTRHPNSPPSWGKVSEGPRQNQIEPNRTTGSGLVKAVRASVPMLERSRKVDTCVPSEPTDEAGGADTGFTSGVFR